MTATGFTLFETAIGRCGIAWGAHGISGVQLPQADQAETRARMLQRPIDVLPIARVVHENHPGDR